MKPKLDVNSSNIVIISQALHHLEKSIFIKEKLFKNARILNFYQDKKKLGTHRRNFNKEYIKHYNRFDELDLKDLLKIKIFVFLSFSPTLQLIELIKKIRLNKKHIVLIQDNHQFSVHRGSINSIILRPDLIIAASESEKKYLEDNLQFDQESIISEGWLFQKPAQKYIAKTRDNLDRSILIAFSAPPEITLLSNETYNLRLKILLWADGNFPDHKISIKLHPHENSNHFKKYIEKCNIDLKIYPSQSSIETAISKAKIIICSNESQIPLDLISIDINKHLIIYHLKKDNFLNEKCIPLKSDSNFGLGTLEIKEKEKIRHQHLSIKKNLLDSVNNKINDLSLVDEKLNSNLDIFLWLYIYGYKQHIINFLNDQKSRKYKNLLNLILNKSFNLNELSNDFLNVRIRDPLCIILSRYYLINSKEINYKNFKIIFNDFFSEYIFQFFFRDFIRLNNLISSKNMLGVYDKRHLNLANKIELLYLSKLKIFKFFFKFLTKIYSLKIKTLSRCAYSISDRILRL